jgi:hypothetical protein
LYPRRASAAKEGLAKTLQLRDTQVIVIGFRTGR